eukprot:TRINITY_DN31587_c0_g1_i1.p2 TRINITY_DN31587_c0_g1~~TRINITY_DN31587_c0_g1_i1.p2  ORF type:complete len:146 (+),score=22.85 TRINITY_DN31587_c0_g1_i1:153-590(+)
MPHSKPVVLPRWSSGQPNRTGLLSPCPVVQTGCRPDPKKCGRVVRDNFITSEEATKLLQIVSQGMDFAPPSAAFGGPTIMDINSGFVRSSEGPVQNMYQPQDRAGFTQEPVSYTHLRAHETPEHLVCRLLLEKKNTKEQEEQSSQ